MPAQISHCLAAEEALSIASPTLALEWGLPAGKVPGKEPGVGGEAVASPARWFRLGAQGPDIFYHNQRSLPSGIHYGALSHKRNYGLIVEGALEALIAAGSSNRTSQMAWLLGFATHAALDRAIHPWVVYRSGWQVPLVPESARYRSCHPFFERLLDVALLRERRGMPIGAMDLEILLPLEGLTQRDGASAGRKNSPSDFPTEEAVIAMLAAGLKTAFPRAAGVDFLIERRILNAISDARLFFKVTNPARTSTGDRAYLARFDDHSGPRAISLLYPESLPEDLDILNLKCEAWVHPAGDGRASTRSLLELFDSGVKTGALAIGLVLDSIEDGRAGPGFATNIGNGGLSITDADGIPVPPRTAKPFPLAELMEKEFERRVAQIRSH